jgi:PHP family Zn ribbon phosphoesterase
MKCPECGKELKKGIIEAKRAGSLTQFGTMVTCIRKKKKEKW